ncbi:hypothetical protein GKZ28_05270 [Clostridium chromiireducens]|uniref:Recombinase family protein n=1 Tax=Clostridium chromiireducens TaxID=225345 RepID=A0A964RK69_9CLOT|nr:recombinase family protein [Clostridium chromiireducens]MVX63108.1 hypothetical protein [Clostridium chromiireducens]
MISVNNGGKRKVAFYARVSTEHESQVSAFENQMKWCYKIMAEHPEWELVEEYSDKGITGTQAKKRPSFLKMIEDALKGNFDLIITREVSRFGRNIVEVINYAKKLKDNGVEIKFISDEISTFDKNGGEKLAEISASAERESRKTSERVTAGQEIARKKNVLYGSGNILGYNRVGKTFVIDDEQAETVRMIFDMYLNGHGVRAIRTELLKQEKKNSKGQIKWFESTISRILENPMYIGKQYQNKTKVVDYLNHIVKVNDKSEYVLIQGTFKSIISEEDFEKAQEIKKKRVKKNFGQKPIGIKSTKDKWMHLLECDCGAKFQQYKWRKDEKTGQIKKGYVCRNRRTNGTTQFRLENNLPLDGVCDRKTLCDWHLELMIKDILEEIWGYRKESVIRVFELIKENFENDEINNAKKLKELNSKIESYNQKRSKLLDLYTDETIGKGEFISKRAEFDENIKRNQDEIRRIEGSVDSEKDSRENKLNSIEKALEEIINFDVERLDEDLIKKLVSKVIARGDSEFEWYLNISDNLEEDVFNIMPNEKLDIKRQKSIETRDTKYILAFKSIITLDRAREYKKKYNKYVRENQWTDIKFNVYVK